MKVTKFEIEGTQEELAQFLHDFDESEGLKGNVDDTYKFFRDNFLKGGLTEKTQDTLPTKSENTKSAVDEKVINLITRVILEFNQQNFTLKQVRDVVGYINPRDALQRHVDDEDKTRASGIAPPSGKQAMTLINESGLYSLILSSKLPSAKAFKRWVTSEVLPSIRKTGTYGDKTTKNG